MELKNGIKSIQWDLDELEESLGRHLSQQQQQQQQHSAFMSNKYNNITNTFCLWLCSSPRERQPLCSPGEHWVWKAAKLHCSNERGGKVDEREDHQVQLQAQGHLWGHCGRLDGTESKRHQVHAPYQCARCRQSGREHSLHDALWRWRFRAKVSLRSWPIYVSWRKMERWTSNLQLLLQLIHFFLPYSMFNETDHSVNIVNSRPSRVERIKTALHITTGTFSWFFIMMINFF